MKNDIYAARRSRAPRARPLAAKEDRRRGSRLMLWRLSTAVLLVGAAALWSVAQAQLPPSQNAGGVEYVTGGFGSDMSEAFKAAKSEYPLALTFAGADEGGSSPYLAEVHVVVKDKQGATVMDVPSAGPYFLARLKPGQYTVEATYMGETQTQRVDIKEGGSAQDVLTWKRP